MNADQLAEIIRNRQTWKVLGEPGRDLAKAGDSNEAANQLVRNAIAAAGYAPFHYDRNVNGIAEPWRVHVLWQPVCQRLALEFDDMFSDIKPGNKLPAMLAACGALVIVNWLPQFRQAENATANATVKGDSSEPVPDDKKLQIDQEHLAASAAMTQNLLLMLTASGFGTYWSSGGQFRSATMFDRLGIPHSEELLAAVFVDYWPQQPEVERLPGKLREKRSDSHKWTTVVER